MSTNDLREWNEAFAAQGLAVPRDLGLADDDARVNRTEGDRPGPSNGRQRGRVW